MYVCCEGDSNAGVGDGGVVVVWGDHVGGTRDSDIVFIAADVRGMSVVRGMRVGVVCEMLCVWIEAAWVTRG